MPRPHSKHSQPRDVRPIYASAMLALQDLPTTFPVHTSVPISDMTPSTRLYIYRSEPTCFMTIDNAQGSIHVVVEAFCQVGDRVVILDVLTYLSDEGGQRQQFEIDSFFRTEVEEMRHFVQHLSDPARLFDDICRSFQLVQQLIIETMNFGLNQDDAGCYYA